MTLMYSVIGIGEVAQCLRICTALVPSTHTGWFTTLAARDLLASAGTVHYTHTYKHMDTHTGT